MRTTRMPGMLCRSDMSTAACVPGDPRSVVHPRRLHDMATLSEQSRLISTEHLKYSRVAADCRRFPPPGERRRSAVTLPTVTRREIDQPKEAPPPLLLPSSTTDNVFQVVVMRVSIHCKGCAGKVRKHISKMEGVTSFSIDLETKRVTVMGHVSPVGVLESISKVKKAEFWTC